ncbi:sugar kinase, ribokinase family [Longilinea arvoryzae]|uniref:Sugar kinase, ribokinase family n=1 Tax=Longilinea arvoryzae TaxID=360412 RepID=A0A0S7BF93_9CHLR|nr:PfkB family carbohydrate kinase [Longilinea arvoryzae]GAP13142.1 sugar kinase, ribokinase family [Longilinea arvoryzae]
MVDVLSFGELLIDFVPTTSGVSLTEAKAFKKAPGGAPANVAVGLARLGVNAGFMGMVGDDAFGHFLVDVLKSNGVSTQGVRFSGVARTALAFISLQKNGERDFMFYRHPSADMLYSPQDVDVAAIRSAKIFHFGSITLIGEPSRSATLFALETAREAGCLISYDPNLRLNLWPGEKEAREGMLSVWDQAHIIKISDEELEFLSGEKDIEKGARSLWRDTLKLLVVTRGSKGVTCFNAHTQLQVPGYAVKAVDTTGAGDGFVAGLLAGMLAHPEAVQDEAVLRSICQRANAVGALTTTRRGAIPALPTLKKVVQFQRSN